MSSCVMGLNPACWSEKTKKLLGFYQSMITKQGEVESSRTRFDVLGLKAGASPAGGQGGNALPIYLLPPSVFFGEE